jgi:hypothetical protein
VKADAGGATNPLFVFLLTVVLLVLVVYLPFCCTVSSLSRSGYSNKSQESLSVLGYEKRSVHHENKDRLPIQTKTMPMPTHLLKH